MHFDRFLTLMYHNVVRDGELRGRDCARLSPSITTYFLEEAAFRDQLKLLSDKSFVLTLSDVEVFYQTPDLLDGSPRRAQLPGALLTFDDGWKGCLDMATGPLREAGMQGLMFVTTGLVGSEFFCGWDDLRQRDKDVWRIGSHSVSHGFLNEEPTREIYKELRDSKRRLEDELGESITTISIPNGAVSDRVSAIAQDVGYLYVFTSEVRFNTRHVHPLNLGRLAIHTETSCAEIERWLAGQIRSAAWKRSFLNVARFVLGPRRYRLLRRRWLGEKEEQLPMSQLNSSTNENRSKAITLEMERTGART